MFRLRLSRKKGKSARPAVDQDAGHWITDSVGGRH